MLEHQILKLHPGDLDDFDFVLTQLNLKEASGQGVVRSVLEEGYSTTDLRRFIPEFRRRLARLNRIHRKVKGRRTPLAALGDFIALSHYECKLTLARYLFTPEDIVTEILGHLQVTRGVNDPGASQPAFVDAVFEVTRGQPGLVSWFGELCTEKYNPGPGQPITPLVWRRVYARACQVEANNTIINLLAKARGPYLSHVISLFTDPKNAEVQMDLFISRVKMGEANQAADAELKLPSNIPAPTRVNVPPPSFR
jgi:hypothetical protein